MGSHLSEFSSSSAACRSSLCSLKLTSLASRRVSVPTDALANKLFGAPEPSSMARSLPTTVPDSPNYRTPRTPRTPHRKDPTMTPRFYPVVKESRPVDAKVRRRGQVGLMWGGFPTGTPSLTLQSLPLPDSQEEEDQAQLQPPHGVPRGLGDGLQRAPVPHRLCQVSCTGSIMVWDCWVFLSTSRSLFSFNNAGLIFL